MSRRRQRPRRRRSRVEPNGQQRKFRVYLWRDGGFWNPAQYVVAENTAVVRRRLEREVGREAARKSSVTAFADVPPASPTSRPRS